MPIPAGFEGYLLKYWYLDEDDRIINVIFPHKYIVIDSWKSTPNQREEIRAYRDDNTRNLTRVTAAGKKTKISFTTRPKLHLAEKMEIQNFFTSGEYHSGESGGDPVVTAEQRKIFLTYWNDETNEYKNGYFYRPNMEFSIYKITENDIIYNPMEFQLVEY